MCFIFTFLLHPKAIDHMQFLVTNCQEVTVILQRAPVAKTQTVTGCNQLFLRQSAGQGQTVNSKSFPFKCQLSRKQVQKWRIWTVAEQHRSHHLATPKNNSVPSQRHPVEPLCSTESCNSSKLEVTRAWKTAERPPDGIIFILSIIHER